jgi:ABC-2 type transport system permease protein
MAQAASLPDLPSAVVDDRQGSRPAPVVPAILALAGREWTRFLRQRNRVIGAIATPVLFWLLLGGGMGDSFKAPGSDQPYLTYFFPGMLLMVVLFTAIFATITLIEDRREGFMQAVLVAPVPRWAIVMGKTLGGASLAAAQAMVLLLLAPLAGLEVTLTGMLVAGLFVIGLSVALVGLGVALAWPMTSTQGYHVAMNLLLMPLWFLSGAVFPIGGGAGVVGWMTYANPLTYGLAGLRRGLSPGVEHAGLPGLGLAAVLTILTAIATVGLACFVARGRVRADAESA